MIKPSLLRALKCLLLLLACAWQADAGTVDPQGWSHSVPVTFDRVSPQRVALPAEALANAQPDLRDLRFVNERGEETPYLLLAETLPARPWRIATLVSSTVENEQTVIVFRPEISLPLAELRLQVAGGDFVAAATVDRISDDGTWQPIATAQAIFRLGAAEKLNLPLGDRPSKEIRVRLSLPRTGTMAVTGGVVRAVQRGSREEELSGMTYSVSEYEEETLISLDLQRAQQRLRAVEFDFGGGTFSRLVEVRESVLGDEGLTERVIAQATLFRLKESDLRTELLGEQRRVDLDLRSAGRHLEVVVKNNDSPPLALKGVRVWVQPTEVVVVPTQPGPHRLLVGNPDARFPQYDLVTFADAFLELPVTSVAWGTVVENPHPRRAEALPGIATQGARLKVEDWKHSRDIQIVKAGVQELTLDDTLWAQAREDLGDLRIVHGETQIPFLIERSGRKAEVLLQPESTPDPTRPTVSRWRLPLPAAGMPIEQLKLESDAVLFRRSLIAYELRQNVRGETYRLQLGEVVWVRAPGSPAVKAEIKLSQRPLGRELWIETDDGDNQAISLRRVAAISPVVRVLFKTERSEGVRLLVGNEKVNRPRYDVSSVGGQLLAAERHSAKLGASAEIEPPAAWFSHAATGALFWIVLAGVVVVLLIVVARLLPKPPTAK